MKAIGSAEGRKMGLPVRSVQEALGLAAADAECWIRMDARASSEP
jgi:hypothetical protein